MTEFLIPIRRYEVREICEYADAKKKSQTACPLHPQSITTGFALLSPLLILLNGSSWLRIAEPEMAAQGLFGAMRASPLANASCFVDRVSEPLKGTDLIR